MLRQLAQTTGFTMDHSNIFHLFSRKMLSCPQYLVREWFKGYLAARVEGAERRRLWNMHALHQCRTVV